MSKLCHSASRHKNCKRIQTLDSKKNAAKKGLLKQTQIWSSEGRPGTYLFQKGSMRGSSLVSYTNSCLKVILDRPAPRGELETSYIHQALLSDPPAFLTAVPALLLVILVRGFRPFRTSITY